MGTMPLSYAESIFHHFIPGFLIQGGGFSRHLYGTPTNGRVIDGEICSQYLTSSQFFITISLFRKYCGCIGRSNSSGSPSATICIASAGWKMGECRLDFGFARKVKL
jgi:hypothetical protein